MRRLPKRLDENAYIETVAKALALLKESYADLTVEILSVENLQTAGEELMTARPACGILEYNIVTSGFYGGCHA